MDKETLQPIEIKEKFSAGANVAAWALIKAPEREDLKMIWYVSAWTGIRAPGRKGLRMKWYVNGKEVESKKVAVSRSPGLRTWAVAKSSIHKGLNEVRLYNSVDILIGRKTFTTSGN